jgi:catechol 2,3-dioxygenase-like lactoylglutathione lyase family enzyme
MKQSIGYVALIVQDYDEAIKFYVDTLSFRLIEDTFIEAQNKRWVLVAPPGSTATCARGWSGAVLTHRQSNRWARVSIPSH